MYRKYICVEVVIFFLLSHVVWNGPSTTLFSCSYEDSQVVQFLIQNKLLPILGRYRASLPLDCPFHSMRDIYSWSKQDIKSTNAKNGNTATWLCPLCGQEVDCDNLPKSANNEYYVLSNGAEDAVCLASYCDIMRCEVISNRLKLDSLQKPSIVIKNEPFEEEKDTIKILERFKKMENPMNKMPCDPNKMEALMERCRAVIRQCTIGLLINLSVKDFEDIEDEMNKAICSYLTCERFWDDNLTEVRHVAVFLCIVIGLIIIGGFCLCYYIVWILFGSLPQEDHNSTEIVDPEMWCNDINANSSISVNGQFLYPWPTSTTQLASTASEQRLPRR